MSGAAAEAEDPLEGLDFGGWTPTGRKTVGPDSELIEVENPDGHKQTAIVYDKVYRDHHRLTTDVELVQSFMEFPMVEGISCLSRAPSGQGLFQYDTGSVLALIEVLRAYRDQRKAIGGRAAIELLLTITQMLQEASENGPMQGIYSHGGITPWRIALDADGEVQLLGYGLPQMDMECLREDAELKVREDSFKYCPPERLTSGYEDISTDIYSLVMIAHEMITGDSLLTGRAADLKKSVELGEAQGKLQSSKDKTLPKKVKDVLATALAFDPIGRFEEPHQFLDALIDALGGKDLPGDTLAEVMAFVRKTTRRGKALMDVGTAGGPRRTALGERKTRMKSAAAARPVRGRGPSRSQDAASVSSDGRWGKVRRSSMGDEEEEETTSAARPSRRRRGGGGDEEDSTRRSAVASRPTRRRRGGGDDEEEESAVATRPTRRRRGGGDDEEDTSDRPTRRTRRGSSDDEDDSSSRVRRSVRRSSSRSSSDGEAEESASSRVRRSTRSRSRSRTSEEPEEVEETEATDTAEEEEEAKPTRSRRSRSRTSSAGDDKGDDKDEAKDDEEKPTRSRRTRSRTSSASKDDGDKSDDQDEAKDDEEEEKPTRSRRSRSRTSSAGKDDGDDSPTRSRRTRSRTSSAGKDDGDDKDDPPTRSRRTRSRTSSAGNDDDKDDGDDKPTRSRSRSRSSASAKGSDDADSEDDDKPTRSRRSRSRTSSKSKTKGKSKSRSTSRRKSGSKSSDG